MVIINNSYSYVATSIELVKGNDNNKCDPV